MYPFLEDLSQMKILSFSLLFVLFITGCAVTELPVLSRDELPSTRPFQGTNVILIQTNDDPAAARENVSRALRLQNYEVTQGMSGDRRITTEPRTFGSGVPGSARYYIELPQESGQPIKLYGEYITQQATDASSFMQFPPTRVSPHGDRRSTSWLSWLEMEDLARSYRGGTLQYDRD
jgi:hypothetical protein